jgi:hypothetical protein
MADVLAVALLAVKMRDPKKSGALYAVSSDVEGAKITDGAAARLNETIVGLMLSAPEVLTANLRLMATVLQSTIAGVKASCWSQICPKRSLRLCGASWCWWYEVMFAPAWVSNGSGREERLSGPGAL